MRSAGRPSSARALRPRSRRHRGGGTISGRSGLPVTIARGRSVPGKDTRRRPRRSAAAPGSPRRPARSARAARAARGSARRRRRRRSWRVPPSTTTTVGPAPADDADAACTTPARGPIAARTLASVRRRWMPAAGQLVEREPRGGTSTASTPRSLPTKWMSEGSWPRATSTSATASPGSRWPAVPPPPTRTRGRWSPSTSRSSSSAGCSRPGCRWSRRPRSCTPSGSPSWPTPRS